MATINSGDISFTLSGGEYNTDPDASLGSNSSTHPIMNERLFANVSSSDAAVGKIDYRCFYINNDSEDATLYGAGIYISYKTDSNIQVQLGFIDREEKQSINISNATYVTSGTFNLIYTDTSTHTISVVWDPIISGGKPTHLANNIQLGLRTIEGLEDVTVAAQDISGQSFIFDIFFSGGASHRSHELITNNSNTLVSSHSVTITTSISIMGGPVNTVATLVDSEVTTPYDDSSFAVPFSDYHANHIYTIGDLRPLDSIPVWVKRTIPVGSPALEDDGFTTVITGQTYLTPTITIQTQPINQNFVNNATFSVVATVDHGANIYYQWKYSTDSGVTWIDVSGDMSDTLVLTSISPSWTGRKYKVVIMATGGAEAVTSSIATLTYVP